MVSWIHRCQRRILRADCIHCYIAILGKELEHPGIFGIHSWNNTPQTLRNKFTQCQSPEGELSWHVWNQQLDACVWRGVQAEQQESKLENNIFPQTTFPRFSKINFFIVYIMKARNLPFLLWCLELSQWMCDCFLCVTPYWFIGFSSFLLA